MVDLVVYTPDGRKVIGEAQLNEEGTEIVANVTDPDVAKKLMAPNELDRFSIGETPKRHNVFDTEEKDKA